MFICFSAALGLCRCLRAFSGCGKLGLFPSCSAWLWWLFSSYEWKLVFFIQSLLIPFPNPRPRLPVTTTILPSVSVSLTFFKIPHISANIQYLLFSVWIMSLNLMSSGFIHVILNGRISFFYGWVGLCGIFSIHSSTNGHFPCLGYCELQWTYWSADMSLKHWFPFL